MAVYTEAWFLQGMGYTEDDSAGQTNIFAVEVFVCIIVAILNSVLVESCWVNSATEANLKSSCSMSLDPICCRSSCYTK